MPSQATDLPFLPQLYQPWQNAPHLGTLVGTDTPDLINALPPPSLPKRPTRARHSRQHLSTLAQIQANRWLISSAPTTNHLHLHGYHCS